MVAVGRGLMSDAKFLAIDEPSFDSRQSYARRCWSGSRAEGPGITVCSWSKRSVTAWGIADYTYVLENGRIAFAGSIDAALADKDLRRIFIGETT